MSVSDSFGVYTFDLKKMKKKLPSQIYAKMLITIHQGKNLDTSIAEPVAHAIKEWALHEGATHFSHWFQPMSRSAAEKHDTFLSSESFHSKDGGVMEEFSKVQLVQGEPDASSLPSGGIRSTFEARGYTVWDASSPVFIIKNETGATLFIPSIFLSYNGDALDTKTPLLRSIKALNKAINNLFSVLNLDETHFTPVLGWEQEFFLIDRKYYLNRPDLLISGRTLFGKESPKGQKLEDHYFGTIPKLVLAFMNDLEDACYKLGIPLATRHNEVAPRQYEIASIYQNANLAVDQNKLFMELMPKIAEKYGLVALLHEKPFQGVNGSGKHNNWSIQTSEGKNLFDPGKSFDDQLRFMLFLMATVNAIHKHSDLLRISIAVPGNDFRLGANEAPPAIMSVFIGDTITSILKKILNGNYDTWEALDNSMKIDLHQLPDLLIGNTDRNRTSPFAFTGDKFEFRAVGSSQTLAIPNVVLNTIFAESISNVTNKIKEKLKLKKNVNTAILATIKELYNECSSVIFNGDNYSEDWVQEAAKRGLPNLSNTFVALNNFVNKTNKELFEKHNVFSERELIARQNVEISHLQKIIQIEANTLLLIANSEILPVVVAHLSKQKQEKTVLEGSENTGLLQKFLDRAEENLHSFLQAIENLSENISKLENEKDSMKKAKVAATETRQKIEDVRKPIDYFEGIIPKKSWPFPTYIDIFHKN